MSIQFLGLTANAAAVIAIPFAVLEFKLFRVPPIILQLSATILCLVALAILTLSIKEYIEKNGKKYNSKEKIKKAMFNIIKNSGNTVIVSRNMSWADDNEILKELEIKSIDGDLKIHLQFTPNNLNCLQNFNNIVKKYNPNFTPSCRFTISNIGHHGEVMHIAVTGGDKHAIYSYSAKDGPIFYLAKDLVRLLEVS